MPRCTVPAVSARTWDPELIETLPVLPVSAIEVEYAYYDGPLMGLCWLEGELAWFAWSGGEDLVEDARTLLVHPLHPGEVILERLAPWDDATLERLRSYETRPPRARILA